MTFAGIAPPTAYFRLEQSPNRLLFLLRHFLFVLLLFQCVFDVALGLKCKCTQNSPKVVCEHGICEVSSTASACLMLDHPHSGRHYACSTSELREGECVEKRSRSGANVKVCSCNSSDFCNYKIWPDGTEQQQFDEGEKLQNDDDEETAAAASDENSEEDSDDGTDSPTNGAATAANVCRMPPVVTISICLLTFVCPAIYALFISHLKGSK